MKIKFAILKRSIRGKFTEFRKGEHVKVFWQPRGTLVIERVKWYGRLNCCNQMVGVLREHLDFNCGAKKEQS